jgi:hypothetical protein
LQIKFEVFYLNPSGGRVMKLAVFVSDYRLTVDTLDRLKADKLGIILVGNGVFHAPDKVRKSVRAYRGP